tara:strand:- start:184 stop:501 length:318 start_codon:yes stop_codon:yes gene_type:complete
MTNEEADKILFHLSSVWPQSKILDATIMSWHQRLTNMDYGLTSAALTRLADTEKWWPSMATVVTEVSALKRAAEPMWKALPSTGKPVSKEKLLADIAKLRDTVLK